MERISGRIKRVKRRLRDSGVARKLVAFAVIASTALSPLSPAFASVALAAETPETATVTLMETEHGTLSFDGTEEKSKTVEVGSEVTVNATPEDGYFADSLSVFTSESDAESVEVKDGKATFTVNGDVTVTATFYENGSAGSAAMEAVEVGKQRSGSVTSVEQYVRENADPQYVGTLGEGEDLARKDVLTVTTTVVDGSKLPDATLETLWEVDEDGDGYSDNADAMYSNAVSHAVLFEVSPDSDYYVGWAGADIDGATLTDWAAVENNANAVKRDGFVVDETTGLVYVPKSYTETNDEGEPVVESSRIQLVYTTPDASAEASFDFTTNMTDVGGNVPGAGKVSAPVASAYTRVTLAPDEETLAAVHQQTVDSVTVNGIEYTPDFDMWTYDAETGVLEFRMAPTGIHALTVNMSNNLGKDIAAFFGISTYALGDGVNNIGTWEFEVAPTAPQSYTVKSHNEYYNGGKSGYVMPAVENPSGGGYESKTAQQALGWDSVNLYELSAGNYSIERTTTLHAQTVSSYWGNNHVTIPSETHLNLTCCHANINADFAYVPGWSSPYEEDDLGARVYIHAVYGNKAIVGVTVPTAYTQAGAGFFEITWKVRNGKLRIQKESGSPEITEGNDLYSLAGAQFTVRNSDGDVMGTLTTDENGTTGWLENLPLDDTYVISEDVPPEGYLPVDDFEVNLTGGDQTITVTDTPANDPAMMLVGKFDGEKTYTGDGNLPQGSASLAGAEFTVEYYDTLDYEDYDSLKEAGVEPTRSWVVRTDSDGYADLSDSYLVSGDSLYYAGNGSPTLPRGTVVVYESKAPEGYNLNTDMVSFQKIQENPTTGVVTYNTPQVPESVKRGGIAIQKLDRQTGMTPQGGASFEGIEFSIINDNANDVIVDGVSYAPGQVVKTIYTDESGYAATAEDALPYGSFIVRETSTNDFYLNTSDDIHATVTEDGTVYEYTATDDVLRGGVEVYKRDLESDLDTPLGGATLDGTTFEIRSLNDNPVIVDGVTYGKDAVVKTLVIKDGYAATDPYLLPAGRFSLQEVKSGEGYNLTDGTAHEFTISENGVLVNPFAGDNVDGHAHNQVKRGDLEFNKKADDNGNRLALVPFKVTSLTTGESHVVVTDENGYFSSASSWNAHTNNTNGNDWALDASADEEIDSSQLDPMAGTWFGLTSEGTMVAADDSLGALPYDSYAIEELRCTNNKGYQLISTTVTVTRHGVTVDYGTLDDQPQGEVVISTNAYDPADGDGSIPVGNVAVADKVTYSGLALGGQYKLVTTVVDAETGEAITVDGAPVSATSTFVAEATSGYAVVEMQVPTYELGGRTVTVFEELYQVTNDSDTLVAEHKDKDDVDQQLDVIAPEIGTTAKDAVDGDKNVVTDGETTVVDTVSYVNLIPGKEYSLTGTLMVKGVDNEGNVTEEALTDADGNPVTAETTFTPEAANGTVDVTFTFDSLGMEEGTEIVAFESLSLDGHELAVHTDINDYGQTVTIVRPEIGTTATDGHDGDKNVVADAETSVVDTVAYKDLVPGKEYTVTGTLHVKKVAEDGTVTEEALTDADGNPVTAETTFTPEAANGTVDVTFTFDGTAIPDGSEVVAFESLSRGDVELAVHADVNDENQTVTFHAPSVGTTATDGLDGDKEVVADIETIITDTIAYNGVLSGTDYTMAGILMDKATGLPVLTGDGHERYTDEDVSAFMDELSSLLGLDTESDGTAIDMEAVNQLLADNADLVDHMVIATKQFTPENMAGSIDMDFGFDSNDVIDRLSGETKDLVVFEVLFKGSLDGTTETKLAGVTSETDLENAEQTVTLIPSAIGTTATDKSDGDHELMAGKDAVITDTVTYEDLIPGKEYTLKATLYDKATGEPLSIADKHVTAEIKFTPNSPDGSIDIDLGPFDASELDGHELVVFEELYKQSEVDGEVTDVLVAEHKDLNDEGQTVTVTSTPKGGSERPNGGTYGKTGGSNAAIAFAILAALALAGGLGAYGLKVRRAAKAESEVDATIAKPNDGSDD